MDDYSIFLASNGYYQHLTMNDWALATKRVENFDTYGLAIVDFHYPETTHLNLQGLDGIYYRFNHIEVEDQYILWMDEPYNESFLMIFLYEL